MAIVSRKYLPYLILLLFSIPLFFLNIHNTHTPGGDDYAQYIKEAQNIATGKPFYQSNYVFNKYNNCYSPPQYPPGFPMLLAPVVMIWGIAIQPMCYFNTIIALCLMLCYYVYFRKYMGATAAICLAVLISYSGSMIDMKQAVLSDFSSMLFVMLYLVARNAPRFSVGRIIALSVFAAMAILIRTQSVLLLFAEVVFLCFYVVKQWRKEEKISLKLLARPPSIFVIGGAVLLLLIANKLVFYCPTSATGFYIDFLGATFHKGLLTIIRDNINFLLTSISGLFFYQTDNSIRTAIVTVMQNCGLIFCLIGFFISVTRRFSFDDIFFVFVCALVLYYPIHDLRYFFPVVAIVFYYCYLTFKTILPAVTSVKPLHVGLLLAAVYLYAGLRYLRSTVAPQPYGYVPQARDWQAFDYLSRHVNDSDVILCSKPRLVTLYTNKKCMIYAWQRSMPANKRICDEMHVKYFLQIDGITDDYYRTFLWNYQHPTDSANIAKGYTLYTWR